MDAFIVKNFFSGCVVAKLLLPSTFTTHDAAVESKGQAARTLNSAITKENEKNKKQRHILDESMVIKQ